MKIEKKYTKLLQYILFLFLIIYSNNPCLASEGNSVKDINSFVVVGHIYPIVHDYDRLDALVEEINKTNVDSVFLLGDVGAEDKEIYNYFVDSFNTEVYFVPGNHELHEKEQYLDNVGYYEKVVNANKAIFFLINSSDSAENINNFLKESLDNNQENKINIILSHHRIWDDSLFSARPFDHDKSYYYDELYDTINNNINSVFSGNSRSQYFTDFSYKKEGYGNQNLHNIYWSDKIGNVNFYSVGMGNGNPRAGFVEVRIIDKELLLKPHYSSLEGDLLPRESFLINPNGKRPDNREFSPRMLSKTKKVLSHIYFQLGFILAIFTAIIFNILYLKLLRKKKK